MVSSPARPEKTSRAALPPPEFAAPAAPASPAPGPPRPSCRPPPPSVTSARDSRTPRPASPPRRSADHEGQIARAGNPAFATSVPLPDSQLHALNANLFSMAFKCHSFFFRRFLGLVLSPPVFSSYARRHGLH